jgi:hypothetical protein
MYWLLLILIILLSTMIAYQDFRFRAVNWILFAVLLLTGLSFSFLLSGHFLYVLEKSFANIIFLSIQLGVLKLYFHFTDNKNKKIIDSKIGKGDLFFLAAACFYFSFLNFICFYLLSLLFSVIYYMAMTLGNRRHMLRRKTIPLAGLQSLFLIAYILFAVLHAINITSDNWITNKILAHEY